MLIELLRERLERRIREVAEVVAAREEGRRFRSASPRDVGKTREVRRRPQNLWWFLHEHRGCPVISPVLVKRLTDEFVRKIDRFAKANTVPVVHSDKGACKEEIAQKKLQEFEGEEGVVMNHGFRKMLPSPSDGPGRPAKRSSTRS